MSVHARPLAVLAAVLLGVVLLAGCGRGEQEVAAATPTLAASPAPEGAEPLGIAPLTGVELFEQDDAEILERAVVVVKVDNAPAARPQTGLDRADIVYEELVEGGATRFIALFHSDQPDAIGPIRSARPEDAAVLPPYGGMFFHSGGRAEVLDALRGAGVHWLGEDRSLMYRESGRRAPHDLVGDGAALFARALDRAGAAEAVPWIFDEEPPADPVGCPDPCGSHPGHDLTISMSSSYTTGFTYDAEAGLYRRSQDGTPHTVTGEGRIGASNVVVLGTQVSPGGCCDSAGNPYTATDVVGQGEAILLRDGERYRARWAKASTGAHLELNGADGAPLALRPGPTWILLAPATALPSG